MPAYVDTFNQLVAVGVIAMQIVILLIVANLLFFRTRTNGFLLFLKKFGFYIGFLVALGAVGLSLFYSNVIGYAVCELCYLQRVFLYPQLILFGMELYKRDRTMVDFSMALAFFGTIVSLFHLYIENGGSSSLSCATGGQAAVSCAARYVYEFGYVTIPVMSLTASVFIIMLLVNYKYMSRQS